MNHKTGGPTLLQPGARHRASVSVGGSHGLPADLARRATQRLRIMALMYAAVFFMAAFVPSLISAAGRAMLFSTVVHWLPGTLAIFVGLAVAVAVGNPRLSLQAAAAIAIVFEIVSSYGIAAAELLQPHGGLDFRNATWIGLS